MKHIKNICPACGGRFEFLELDIGCPSNCPYCKFQVFLQPPPQAGGILGEFFKRHFSNPHKPQEHHPSPLALPSPEAKEVPSPARSVDTPPIPAPSREARDVPGQAPAKRDFIMSLEPLTPKDCHGKLSTMAFPWIKDAPSARKFAQMCCYHGRLSSYRPEDTPQAIQNFAFALLVDPNCAEAWHHLGIALFGLGNHDGAVRALSYAIEANPKDATSSLYLGNLHISRKRYREAAGALKRSTEIDPTCQEAWHGLGIALSNLMQMAGANDAFRHAVELKPDDVGSWKHLALGLAVESEYDAALEAAQAALRLAPNDAEVQGFCASLMMEPSGRESFFGGLRYHIWQEYLERERGIKLDP